MSRVAVFGAGYVGLVTGACFADLGHDVVIRDVLPDRIDALKRGEVPIYEPGLEELLARNASRLSYTLDVDEAVDGADFLYVAVGTPPTYSGDADLSAVWTVVDELAGLESRAVVVMKSTVPVGTGAKVRHRLDERGLTQVGYVSNPEFTAEGTAIHDFQQPDRIVIGAFDEADGDAVAELHRGLDGPIVRCDVASAEMIKLAANAALMTRISFINEIANVCEATGADVVRVAEGIGLDRRIGPSFLRAGIGYGGVLSRRRRDGPRARTPPDAPDDARAALRGDRARRRGRDPHLAARRRRAGVPADRAAHRREYDGEIVEVRTKMGRRVRCTPDHPFVVQDGTAQACERSHRPRLAADRAGSAGARHAPRTTPASASSPSSRPQVSRRERRDRAAAPRASSPQLGRARSELRSLRSVTQESVGRPLARHPARRRASAERSG